MTEFCIKCIKSEKTDLGITYGQFLLDSLKPGQGLTIGTFLRRALLGDLKGSAITEVNIEGVTHEFSTLKGAREDILEIFLNLKGIIVKNIDNDVKFGTLKVKGPAVITANCIKLDKGLEIKNPNHYITSISKNSELKMKFKFECGTGYKLADYTMNKKSDFLQIDALFMPVTKVDVKIENNFKDSNINSESVILEIWTNGTITPHEALYETLKNTIKMFSSILENKIKDDNIFNISEIKDIKKEKHKDISIEELQLSARSYNCLKNIQINSVSDLLKYSPKKLLEIKNFGKKSADEIVFILKTKLGIEFD